MKFTALSWAKDGSGFYYSRFPETDDDEKFQSLNLNQKVYFHQLGEAQSDDRIVYERPDEPEWLMNGAVTDDGRYLVITIAKGTDSRYRIVVQDLEAPDSTPFMLIDNFDFDYTLIGNIGNELVFRTNNGAPRNRLIAISVDNPAPENWRELIGEAKDVLDGVSLASLLETGHGSPRETILYSRIRQVQAWRHGRYKYHDRHGEGRCGLPVPSPRPGD